MPGFISATDDHHLTVSLKQIYADPVKFAEGDRIGSVGVMLHNRRRNRLNCIVESVQPDSCCLKVLQSFGNCPKYIQGNPFLSEISPRSAYACIGRVPATFCMYMTTQVPEEARNFLESSALPGRLHMKLQQFVGDVVCDGHCSAPH